MKAFQIAAFLLSSWVLGAPTGSQGGDVVSAQNPVGSDSVTPTGDATLEGETDPNFIPPAGGSTANDPADTEEEEGPELTVTPSVSAEAGSEDDSGNAPAYGGEDNDEIVSGDSGDTVTPDDGTAPGAGSGDSTEVGDVVTDEDSGDASSYSGGDSSGGGGNKGFKSVLYFTNWGIYSANTQPQDIPADKVTHLLYAFADIKPDGEVVPSDLFADVQKQLDDSSSGSGESYSGPENTDEGTGNAGLGTGSIDSDTENTNGDSNEDTYAKPDNTGVAGATSTAAADTEGTNGDAETMDPGSESTGGDPASTDEALGSTDEGSDNSSGGVEDANVGANPGNTNEGTEDSPAGAKKRTDTGAPESTGGYTGGEDTTGGNTEAVDTTGNSTGEVYTTEGGATDAVETPEGITGAADTAESTGAVDTEDNTGSADTIEDSTGSGGTTEGSTGAIDTAGDSTGAVDTTGDSTGAVDTTTGGEAHGCVGEIFRLKKENRHLKVLLSIGGWTYSKKFPPVAASEAGRQRFASSAVKLVADWGFDGLDIDWEYPKDETEAQNFVLLLKACREALDKYSEAHAGGYHFELTVATPAGASNYEVLDIEGMDPLVDAWHLMAYDYAGSWDDTSGHQAALFASQGNAEATKFNTKDAVEGYLGRGIASQKIAVGIPLYGRSFMNTDGMGKSYSGLGQGSIEQGVWLYRDLPRPGATEEWDETALASYSYDPSTRELVTYDTVQSATQKAKWMVEQNLGGAVFWEASGDKQGDESLVCAVVGTVPSLDTTENLLNYPQSPYANIRGGGSGGGQSGSEGDGSYGGGGSSESPDNSGPEIPDTSGTPPVTSTEEDDQSGDVGSGEYDDWNNDQSGDGSSNAEGDNASGDTGEITISSPDPDADTTEPSSGSGGSGAGNNGNVDDWIGGDTVGGQVGDEEDDVSDGFDGTTTPTPEDGEPCSDSGDTAQSDNGDYGTSNDDTVNNDQAGSGEVGTSGGPEGTPPVSSTADNPQTTGSGEGQVDGDDDQLGGDDEQSDIGAGEESGNEEIDQHDEDDEVYAEGDNDSDVGNGDTSGNTEVIPTTGTEDEQLDDGETNTGEGDQTSDDVDSQYVDGADQPGFVN